MPVYWTLCVLCVYVFVCVISIISNQSASTIHINTPMINLMPCCTRFIARCFWY